MRRVRFAAQPLMQFWPSALGSRIADRDRRGLSLSHWCWRRTI